MQQQTIQPFHVIGISVRTTDENGQAGRDIPALWDLFIGEGIAAKIPGKTEESIYCIYTDYEKDHTLPYTTILGCKVSSLDHIPEGMTGKTINQAAYTKFIAQGNMLQGSVFNEWTKIWHSDLDRTFTADFEVYDERSRDTERAIVDIFIAVRKVENAE